MAAIVHRLRDEAAARDGLQRLTQAAAEAAGAVTLREALQLLADGAAAAVNAELSVIRVLDPGDGQFAAAAVATTSQARAAEIEGARVPATEVSGDEVSETERLPAAVQRLAKRIRATAAVQIPVSVGAAPVATLELFRHAGAFSDAQLVLARFVASQIGLCVRALGVTATGGENGARSAVDLAAEALAAGGDEQGESDRLARLAAAVWCARAALVWELVDGGEPAEVARAGQVPDGPTLAALVAEAHAAPDGVSVTRDPARLPDGCSVSAVVHLGRPATAALQLLFDATAPPAEDRLNALGRFGVSAARALRGAARARELTAELTRSRALLGVVGHAIAELSLAHTLTTALDRVAALLGVDRVGVYLREGETLTVAGAHGLTGPHALVADRLLELARGPARARGVLAVGDVTADPRLETVRQAARHSEIEAALAAPLVAHDELIGLLAAYPPRRRTVDEQELALFAALAGQLAVVVQNARLHEQAKRLGESLEHALDAEREAGRRLGALYEVSRSFAQSMSVEPTLEAVTRAAVQSLGAGAAVLRIPDARGEAAVTQTLHVADSRLEQPLAAMLSGAPVLTRPVLQRLFRRDHPVPLDPGRARALGGSYELLVPFLEKGSTAVVIPVATPAEVLGTLTLISLDRARPIRDETVDAALSLAGQAALAIENARLYEQQKQFSDAMQQSLLPRDRPEPPGLELGVVYESSSRMDVGGDVYDFMELDDGRLAIVLGDVTGHGIDAAADMAMAKFVFRSLAREHPEPEDFLASANEVVAGEIGVGKFITLVYMTIDSAQGKVACAAAGHPPPRLISPDGSVDEIGAGGVALGVEAGQRYEPDRRRLLPGATVVLFTDGVIEARRSGELYGLDRLDAFLAANSGLSPQHLAEALVSDCRRFGGGELSDDCAVVAVRRR